MLAEKVGLGGLGGLERIRHYEGGYRCTVLAEKGGLDGLGNSERIRLHESGYWCTVRRTDHPTDIELLRRD